MNGLRHTNDLSRLRRAVPILALLEHCGLHHSLRPSRSELVGPCPLPGHAGDRSNRWAFRLNPAKGCFHCFTHCGGGDVVRLAAQIEDGDYAAAARLLVAVESITASHSRPGPQGAPTAPDRPRDPGLPPFQPYTRRLPLLAEHPLLRAKGIRPATAAGFDCGFWPRQGFLDGCIGVRLHDLEGQPLGYAGRRLDPDAISRWGKWKLPTGLPRRELLFNWHRAAPLTAATALVVVEGPLDAIRVHQAGWPAVVALLGTQASDAQLDLLRRFNRVVLLLDGDRAGTTAAHRLAAELPLGRVEVALLPPGKGPPDVTDDCLRGLLRG